MKKIDLNKSEELENFKNSISSVLDKRINEAKLNESLNSFNKLNFGEMKLVFESISPNLMSTEKGKSVIAKYVKALRESKELKKVFMGYNGLINAYTNPTYINEAIELSKINDKKTYLKEKKNISNIIIEGIKLSDVSLEKINEYKNSEPIMESIDYLLTNEKNMKNLNVYLENLNKVISYNADKGQKEPVLEGMEVNGKTIQDTIEKLTEGLEKWEKEAISDYFITKVSQGDENHLFEEYKSDCIATLDESIDECDNIEEKSRLSKIKNQLEVKEYNKETIKEDILNFANLKQTILS